MPQTAIYCRLSIEDRNKPRQDPSQSIRNQKALLCDYCRQHGWDIFDIYIDDGYSGIDRSRPAWNRMLRDCENGAVDIVLCKDQSRFSRDIVVVEQILGERFPEWGVRFVGVADNADTADETYGTMRLFTSAYNELYVRDISAKIRRTLAHKREQGEFVGSFAPYGYAVDPDVPHHLVPDPEAAAVVRELFAQYAAGAGYRSIAQALNAKGIPSPAAYKQQRGSRYVNRNADRSHAQGQWTSSTIARILANEVYTGTLVQGKSHHISYKNKKRRQVPPADWVRIPHAHEAIIDDAVWQQAQARRQSHTRAGTCSQTVSPLSGKVKCAVCGSPMKRNVYYNKARTVRYYNLQCAACKSGAGNCPNSRTISGLALERSILTELRRMVAACCTPEDIELPDVQGEEIRRLEQHRVALEQAEQTAQARLLSMYKDKLDGHLTGAEYALFRAQLTAEAEKIAAGREAVQSRIAACRLAQEQPGTRMEQVAAYMRFAQLDRSIADAFLDTVEIGMPDETGVRDIQIHWKL